MNKVDMKKKFNCYLLFFSMILIAFQSSFSQTDDEIRVTRKPKPLLRILEFNKERFGDGPAQPESRIKAINQSNNILLNNSKNKAFLQAQQPEWQSIGPNTLGGRVRSIAHHPTKTGVVYIGAAAGGIWKTTDGGNNWLPIFDNENSIAFGSIAIDKQNPKIIYAATGEMVIGGGTPYFGSGIYKSTDEGSSWRLIGLSDVSAFCKIFVHPVNSNIIVAGGSVTSGGFYVSTDAGLSWEKRYDGNVTDISINPSNSDEYFIGVNGSGIFYTTDLGKTWGKRITGISDIGGRISVQASASNFNTVYTLLEKSNSNGIIYKSTNKGQNCGLLS